MGPAGSRAGRGPLAHGFADDQRWTLGRIKTLIGRLFHVGYTPEGVWKLMRRHGWSCQVPVRQALERDEEAVAVWEGRCQRPLGNPVGWSCFLRAGGHQFSRLVAACSPGGRG